MVSWWSRSLFEDNAEYGFGMMLATKQRRQKVYDEITMILLEMELPDNLQTAFKNWQKFHDNHEKCDLASSQIDSILRTMGVDNLDPRLKHIYDQKDMMRTQSHWLVGGDGWAYDIGYGGLDHIISRNEDVNILVLDTEMYSNTGGQVSKATQLATVTKYATHGKRQNKKDLGLCAMQYENTYVASVALGANMNQCVQAFKEAEAHKGTSLIIAYSPCIDWGIEMKHMMDEQKEAVDSGYWTLYRFDPGRTTKGLNPFVLDSKKLKSDLAHYLNSQNRFEQLRRNKFATAEILQGQFDVDVKRKHSKLQRLAMDDYELLEHLKGKLGEATDGEKMVVLYGSETGNAAALAQVFTNELLRRGIRAKCLSMDDFDVDDLPGQSKVFMLAATCGQGEFPSNCRDFWKSLSDKSLPEDFLKGVEFTVFGLGDSSYVYYNEVAKCLHQRLTELGGACIMDMGLGDDKDEDRYESVWNEWLPELWNNLGTDPPSAELLPPSYNVTLDTTGTSTEAPDVLLPPGAQLVPITKNVTLTPPGYDRDIRHYEFDLRGTGMNYSVGDCLGIYPHNDPSEVSQFLDEYGMSPDTLISLEDLQDRKEALPSTMTAKQLFTEVLDVFGKPPRRFYETLQIAAKDEAEAKELEYLQSKEGKDKFKELLVETPHFSDLMKKYPSTKLNVEYLIDHIPRIKPRLYSIASASEMTGDTLHLCIIANDWETPGGKYRHGACTRYLKGQSLGSTPDLIAGKMNSAGINWPDTHQFPCVMVALGTGIAPIRAMIQEREMARIRGEPTGEMAMFYGARNKKSEYTYGDEFEEYHSGGKGVLTHHVNAFSRDQEHKIYVQNRIAENPEMIYDYLWKKKGYFYLCGPAGNVPTSVRKGICDAFVLVGGHTPEEAEKMVTSMQIEGRYNIEAW